MRMPIALAIFLTFAGLADAQGPGGPPPGGGGAADVVAQLMAFDKDKDGKLSKAEVTDTRLQRLFDRADADKDGTVTKAELTALAAQQPAPGGGGPGGRGMGGPGGRMGGFSKPGDVLSPMFRQMLNLTPEQQKEVDAIQKDVDARMAKVLSAEQQAQLKEMRDRGPGGPGGPPGGFGGRRPGGEGPPNP